MNPTWLPAWVPAWPRCTGECVVQYDAKRDWLWCIHCRHPKLTAEQLDRQGTRI